MNITPNKYKGYDIDVDGALVYRTKDNKGIHTSINTIRIFKITKPTTNFFYQFLDDEKLIEEQTHTEGKETDPLLNYFFLFKNSNQPQAKALLRLNLNNLYELIQTIKKKVSLSNVVFVSFLNSEFSKASEITILQKEDEFLIEAKGGKAKIEVQNQEQTKIHLSLILKHLITL